MHQGSREELIMDAAEAVLARFGERRMTMDDVAEAIGLSRPAIYQYFKSKSNLVQSTLSRLHERNLRQIYKHIHNHAAGHESIRLAVRERETFLFGLQQSSSDKDWFIKSSIKSVSERLGVIEVVYVGLIRDQLNKLGYGQSEANLIAQLLKLYAQDVRRSVTSEAELFERLDYCVERLVQRNQAEALVDEGEDASRNVM